MVSFENFKYSVPSHLLDARVYIRSHDTGPDEKVIIVQQARSVRLKSPVTAGQGPAVAQSSMSTYQGPGPGPRATTP
jgi:hypothetical protein